MESLVRSTCRASLIWMTVSKKFCWQQTRNLPALCHIRNHCSSCGDTVSFRFLTLESCASSRVAGLATLAKLAWASRPFFFGLSLILSSDDFIWRATLSMLSFDFGSLQITLVLDSTISTIFQHTGNNFQGSCWRPSLSFSKFKPNCNSRKMFVFVRCAFFKILSSQYWAEQLASSLSARAGLTAVRALAMVRIMWHGGLKPKIIS